MECGNYNEMVNVPISICEMPFLFFFVLFSVFLSFVGAKVLIALIQIYMTQMMSFN